PGAGLEGVGGEGAPERQLHVGVDVDAAGDDVLAGGVDRLVGRPVVASGRGQGDDLLVLDEDIGGHPVGGGDDGSVGDDGACHRPGDRKSTRLNSSHVKISYAVFCL